jgi:trimethylamine---corrinoid protein Co-methyltransferase
MEVIKGKGPKQAISTLSDEQLKDIHLGSLEILEGTGMFVEAKDTLELLSDAGAIVDGNTVKIKSTMVEDALRTVPNRVVLANRDGKRSLFLEGTKTYYRISCDNTLIMDPYTRERRPFVSDDYKLTAKIIEGCDNLHAMGCAGNAADYPANIRAQVGFKQSIQYSRKPFVAAPINAVQMKDIFDMAAVIAGNYENLVNAPFVVATCEPTTPLAVFRDAADILILSAKENLPVVWYGMPCAGATAPCTLGAVLTLGNAEILAGLVIHQLTNPGAPFIYGLMPGAMDMRSTQWGYGSPEFALMLTAATKIAHSYGLPFYGTAGCSDSTDIDEQAAAEATMMCMLGQMSGANLIHDVGLMAGNQFVSPEMMVLTNELIDMVGHATQGIDTSRDGICLDLIKEVGPRGQYVNLDHTNENYQNFWYSDIFKRPRLSDLANGKQDSVRDRINQKTRDIIESDGIEDLSADVISELDELQKKWKDR